MRHYTKHLWVYYSLFYVDYDYVYYVFNDNCTLFTAIGGVIVKLRTTLELLDTGSNGYSIYHRCTFYLGVAANVTCLVPEAQFPYKDLEVRYICISLHNRMRSAGNKMGSGGTA